MMYILKCSLLLLVARSCLSLSEVPKMLTAAQLQEYNALMHSVSVSVGCNEEAFMNFTELTTRYGYPTSEHTVITEDGYVLTMFRLQGKSGRTKPTPVLMMHGLIDSADTWIVSGPDVGLAYILADQGYDVWCGNHRGNRYTRKHVKLNPDKDPEFWDFTFHQHGVYDVPAMVDYILEQTGTQQVAYVGHSQGTADFFVLASTRPEYNKKIKVVVCLAPVAWLYNLFSPPLRAAAKATNLVKLILKIAGLNEVFGSKQLAAIVLEVLCQFVPKAFCGSQLFLLSGYNPKYISRKSLEVVFGHFPSGTSRENLVCYGKWIYRDSFSRCDLGKEKNLEIYGTPEAAEYNLTAVTAPVALFYGSNDWLVSLKDVETLEKALPNVVQSTLMAPWDWSHVDFVWSERLIIVASQIIELFEQFGV